VRDKYIKHRGEDIVLIVDHEHHTIVLVVLPELLLPLQRTQWLDCLTAYELQSLYWIALMRVLHCAKVVDAHVPILAGSSQHQLNHIEQSGRLQRIGVLSFMH
jgi:hypothetical protein